MKTAKVCATKIGETEKAYRVIYHHFENPSEFATVYLPKSQTIPASPGVCWEIPLWLKNKIAGKARRWRALKFVNPLGVEDYLYGFGETRYDAAGFRYRMAEDGSWHRF